MAMMLLSRDVSAFENSESPVIDRKTQGGGHDDGCVLTLGDCRTLDDVSRAQIFIRENGNRLKISGPLPEHQAFAFARAGWIAFFERQPGKFHLLCRDSRLQNKTLDKNAAFRIHDKWTESFAEFLVKGIADGADVFRGLERESRRERPLDMKLTAIKHIEFEGERGGRRIEAVADKILARRFQQRINSLVEGCVF